MRISAERMRRFRVMYREGYALGATASNPFGHPVYFGKGRWVNWERKVFTHGFSHGAVEYANRQVLRVREITKELDRLLDRLGLTR